MSERLETFAVFASFILSGLYDNFPILSNLDRRAALEKAEFDFQEIADRERRLRMIETIRQQRSDLLDSNSPHLTEDMRRGLENRAADPAEVEAIEKLREEVAVWKQKQAEHQEVFNGTVVFLEAEGYIRQSDDVWQLTEKGFAHLNKRFKDGFIESSEDSLISKIKKEFSNPSKLGAQTLLSLIGSLAGSAI
jgi:hypothetical protein